jgi:flagellar basal-body rod modification protein FlgD
MITSEINSVANGVTKSTVAESTVLGKDDFLHLLITQLQNQDPLNPADSTEFTAQLAQFSSLEQLSNVNDNLVQLQNLETSTNNSQAVSLLGKEITANGNFLKLSNGTSTDCEFRLDREADTVVVNIYDHTNEFVKAFESKNLSSGKHSLTWDGTDRDGNPANDGNYTFEIMAVDVNGNTVNATAFFTGTVDTVTFENNTPFLVSENQKIALGDVIQVAKPSNLAEDLEPKK